VQVLGRIKARMLVPSKASAADIEALVLADESVAQHLAGKPVRKVIVVPGRMVNIVTG